MFNIFSKKTKELSKQEKLQKLQAELDKFTLENEQYFNSYCFDGKEIILYLTPKIHKGEVVMQTKTHKTPDGYVYNWPIYWLRLIYGDNFMYTHRNKYIDLQHQLKLLGLKISKIE